MSMKIKKMFIIITLSFFVSATIIQPQAIPGDGAIDVELEK